MFEVGQKVRVNQIDSGHGIIDANGENGVITFVGRANEDSETMVYVEWVDRPLRQQKNGAFRPYAQIWLAA